MKSWKLTKEKVKSKRKPHKKAGWRGASEGEQFVFHY
jgi:hypothetical protein